MYIIGLPSSLVVSLLSVGTTGGAAVGITPEVAHGFGVVPGVPLSSVSTGAFAQAVNNAASNAIAVRIEMYFFIVNTFPFSGLYYMYEYSNQSLEVFLKANMIIPQVLLTVKRIF
jgi:hypothetical protein